MADGTQIQNPLAIFGFKPEALATLTYDQLSERFKKLTKKLHPNVLPNPSAEEKLMLDKIMDAWDAWGGGHREKFLDALHEHQHPGTLRIHSEVSDEVSGMFAELRRAAAKKDHPKQSTEAAQGPALLAGAPKQIAHEQRIALPAPDTGPAIVLPETAETVAQAVVITAPATKPHFLNKLLGESASTIKQRETIGAATGILGGGALLLAGNARAKTQQEETGRVDLAARGMQFVGGLSIVLGAVLAADRLTNHAILKATGHRGA